MSNKQWWEDERYLLGEIENEDTHVTYLCGREVDGVWEYAAVRWRHHLPRLLWTVRGKELAGDGLPWPSSTPGGV